jgi:peptidyl-prolyl cis-trans isomerase C
MKTTLKLWIFAMAIVMMATSLPALAEEGSASSDDKAAVVNGTVIPMSDLDKEIMNAKHQYARMNQPFDDSRVPEMKKMILDRMIDMELLYQESTKRGLTVGEEEANEEFGRFATQFPDETSLKNQLAMMGQSEEDLKKNIIRGRSIENLIDKEVGDKIVVSEEDAKNYYDTNQNYFVKSDQVKASHILIKVEPTAEDAEKTEAMGKIKDIQKKIDEGGDFAELAKEFSEGPSGQKGGDLGFFGRGDMVPSFEEAAFALEVGQVSEPVETRFGYHLIRVFDKRPSSTTPFETVKGQIEQFLKNQKMQEAVMAYIATLKEKAEVERFIP